MADKFVPMFKDGETIHVHPSIVAEHERLGWVVLSAPAKELPAPAATNEIPPELEADAPKGKGKRVRAANEG
jgi:hypothetical protein